MGPFLVDREDVDPANLILRTYVNGQVVQEAQVSSDLMFSFTWGILPPRAYFKFDPASVAQERESAYAYVEVTG